jgi:hypothetical protein
VGLQTGEARRPNQRPDQEYFEGNHVCSSWFFLFKNWPTQLSPKTQQTLDRREMHGEAIGVKSLQWLYRC